MNGQLIGKKDNSGTRTYFHNDHLGSVSVTTDQSGNLLEETAYDPWGEVKSGGTKSKFLYTGQEHDGETGLHYYNARYYNSDIRRFAQPDTIIQNIYNPQDLNHYTYARNNPLKYTDPTGHYNILDYNNALNQYWKAPTKQNLNNVNRTVANIRNPQNDTSKQGPATTSGGGNNGGSSNTSANNSSSNQAPKQQKALIKNASSPQSSNNQVDIKGMTHSKSSNRDLGTIGICTNAGAGLAGYGAGSACVVYSIKENRLGTTGTVGGGLSTGIFMGTGVSVQFSNAQSISELYGQDVVGGGSFGEGIEFNGEVSISVDNPEVKTLNVGVGLGGSFSLPLIPGEIHGGTSYTY